MATSTVLDQYLLLLDQPLARINSKNWQTSQTQVLVCCRNHPTATGCQSKWAESQSDEQWKKNNKKAILPEPWRSNWQHQVPVLWDGGWTRWRQRLHLHPPLLRGGTGIIVVLLIMQSKISSTISKCNYVLCWNQETQLLGAYKKMIFGGQCQFSLPLKKCGPYSREKFSYLFFVENWILHVWIGFYKSHTAANLSLPILSIETVFWTINALFHGIYCLSHREKAKWGCFLG